MDKFTTICCAMFIATGNFVFHWLTDADYSAAAERSYVQIIALLIVYLAHRRIP